MNGWSIIAGAVGVLPSMVLLGANVDLFETLATVRVLMLAWLPTGGRRPTLTTRPAQPFLQGLL